MRRFVWLFLLLLFGGVAHAEEGRGSSGFCLASDDRTNTYYYSDVFTTDPRVPTEEYRKGYSQKLASQGLSIPVSCLFTDLPQNVPTYLDGLRQQCSDCAVYDLRKVAWRPNRGDAEDEPEEIAAPLPQLESIMLDGEQGAFVQVHSRVFACKGEIRLSYSLRPVPERGIEAAPLRGTLTIEGRAQRFDAGVARPEPGHRLGCDAQTVRIGNLKDYEDRLVSGTFSDGKVMWSRTQMIEQFLGRILVFSLDHAALSDVQRLPAQAKTGPTMTPADPEDARTTGLNRQILDQNAAVDARNAAAKADFDRKQAQYDAARARYEAEVQAHEARMKAAEAASSAYEQQLKDYRQKLGSGK